MEERIEFQTFNDFLEQGNRVKKKYSKDGYLFFDSYEELKEYYGGGSILLPESVLKEESEYFVIKKT